MSQHNPKRLVNDQDKSGRSAAFYAVYYGNCIDILEYCNPSIVDLKGRNLFHYLVQSHNKNDVKVIDGLLEFLKFKSFNPRIIQEEFPIEELDLSGVSDGEIPTTNLESELKNMKGAVIGQSP